MLINCCRGTVSNKFPFKNNFRMSMDSGKFGKSEEFNLFCAKTNFCNFFNLKKENSGKKLIKFIPSWRVCKLSRFQTDERPRNSALLSNSSYLLNSSEKLKFSEFSEFFF